MRDRSVFGHFMREPQSHNGTRQPKDRGQETECLARLPSITHTSSRYPRPVKHGAVALRSMEVVDQKAKGGEPGGGDEEIGGPMDEASSEG